MAETLDDDWLRMPPIRIGPVPPTLPAPDRYVLLEEGEQRLKRIDLFMPVHETNIRTILRIWAGWVVIGYCNLLFLVPVRDGEVIGVGLSEGGAFDYICDLWVSADFLLVATGEGLLRIETDGTTLWRNLHLGLDGVEIGAVENNVVRGRGDWDPPGGWKDFAVDLSTGERIA